ncbi:hypothetical protein CI109_103351 [Kwoniella shandongensis]|uniref:Uncharacterized protein n=1 Tax=Kwoniella shandongensis TaxID=1734106 RepID=A0A5M6BXS0_9TREE|nr:uncharacterized protein CI109_004432 [Kwoniella shandongensis]KAA5527141.1 hypothetical protein CI109_004432 [Kwoniella shandongensis]
MAAALHMQIPSHRPSMDRSPSFEQPTRARSTPPFASPYDAPTPHTRSNSSSSNTSPYNQPFSGSYFPPPNQMYSVQPQPWSTTPVPATAFYTPPFHAYPNQPVFQQGYQQSQADYAAWANAYQHMVMASVAGGAHPGGMTPPASTDHQSQNQDRRRTTSGPGGQSNTGGYFDQAFQPQQAQQQSQHKPQSQPQPQSFHPYKRGPASRPSRDQLPRSSSVSSMPSPTEPTQSGMSRSTSVPIALDSKATPTSTPTTLLPPSVPIVQHTRDSSTDSKASSSTAPPRFNSHTRADSSSSDRSGRNSGPSSRTASPVPRVPAVRAATPLHPGPITNATNTPSASRPSPLSQTSTAPDPTEKMVKSGGLKGRLRKALDKDAKKEQKFASPVKQSLPPPTFASPSETSTRSATPPVTPPQDLPPPSAPFTYNPTAMGSEVSLADTERTATTTTDQGKGKRSMFRMKNMSTDNISLSSTVSSASMMIRKMGSLGKLARRNSLMGISRIFKDKPKDEDAALPEKEGKKKKDKKKKGKGEAAPAAVSHAVAQSTKPSEDDDRALAGLTPAAKLARQHTLRSRAEVTKKPEASGEPTWDNNTATRQQTQLPSVATVTTPNTGPEVVRVQPRQAPTVVHAVAVTEQEYDSEDDSSEGETVEDVTMTLARTRLSDEADAEFQATWGNAYIDRNAVPKKGILKSVSSYSQQDFAAKRQRSNSTREPAHPQPNSLDTLAHPSPRIDDTYDPFSPNFSPFDRPTTSTPELYQNPVANSSAPTLSIGTETKPPVQARSMTAPARKKLIWAPECAVYVTYSADLYDRRSEPATCSFLNAQLAAQIKQELNEFKLEMPVHEDSKQNTQYFA